MILLFVGMLFFAGQAITFAWLSAFPERIFQLESLTLKFWLYVVLSILCLIINLFLLMKIVISRKKKKVD